MTASSRTGQPITIAPYDPAWPEKFRRERDLIYDVCGRDQFVRIEHIGSTAVPGLAAKPIIDIMPGVRSIEDFTPDIAKLAAIGYQYVPEYEKPLPGLAGDEGMPFRRYFRKDEDGRRAFHLHVVEVTTGFWRDHQRFRNWLRVFPADRDAYADLKRRLAAEYNAALQPTHGAVELNRDYTDRKSDFVAAILAKAQVRIDRSNPIVLAPHDPSWRAAFECYREEIARTTGGLIAALEHVGSTSVPGLAAKPKIDIAAGLRDMAAAPRIADLLAPLGYHNPDGPEAGAGWWVLPRREVVPPVNLHLVPLDGRRWRDYADFRDYLRAHEDARRDYENLKRQLAQEFGRDRIGYPEAKSDFVATILERARAHA